MEQWFLIFVRFRESELKEVNAAPDVVRKRTKVTS